MGLTTVNKENEGASPMVPVNKSRKSTNFTMKSVIQPKSMIPVPKNNSEGENMSAAGPDVSQKIRRPLAPMQGAQSPQVLGKNISEKILGGNNNKGTPAKAKVKSVVFVDKRSGTNRDACSFPASVQRCHEGFPGTPQNSPSKTRPRKSETTAGNKASLKLKSKEKTEEEESIAYWKELSEARRQALDAALQENYDLHKRVEELEKENANLEEIVKEGRQLAEMINSIADDDGDLVLDESGISVCSA